MEAIIGKHLLQIHNDEVVEVVRTAIRSGLSDMMIGNTSEKILERIESSVLAVNPYSFK